MDRQIKPGLDLYWDSMLPNEAIEYIEKLSKLVKDTENEVILCVPYTDLFYALLTAQNTNTVSYTHLDVYKRQV